VFNHDLFQRVFCQVATLGDYRGHRLADIADLVHGERRPTGHLIVTHVRPGADRLHQAGEFLPCDDRGHAFYGPGSRGIEVRDARVRIRAAQERRIEESRRAVVVGVRALTGHESPVFPALDPCPYKLGSELIHDGLWLIAYGIWPCGFASCYRASLASELYAICSSCWFIPPRRAGARRRPARRGRSPGSRYSGTGLRTAQRAFLPPSGWGWSAANRKRR